MSEPDALVVFTPSGKRGRFALGTSLLQAARTLGVDRRFRLRRPRAFAGAARSDVLEGEFAKHNVISRAANHVTPFDASSSATPTSAAPSRLRDVGPLLSGAGSSGRSRRRRARREPGASAGRAQARRDASDRHRSGRAAALCRGRRARHARSLQRPAPPARWRSPRNGASERRAASLPCCAAAEGLARGRMEGHRRAAQGREIVAVSGFVDRAFGVAFDIGSTTIAAHLCDLESGEVSPPRFDEPADPLRRGSDEPRLLCDDEPRRRRRADEPCAPRSTR
jgi:hypothetical protein